jgi:hypothetical protein
LLSRQDAEACEEMIAEKLVKLPPQDGWLGGCLSEHPGYSLLIFGALDSAALANYYAPRKRQRPEQRRASGGRDTASNGEQPQFSNNSHNSQFLEVRFQIA